MVTKGAQGANPATIKKGAQVTSESSIVVLVKPFSRAGISFLDFMNQIQWNLSNECSTLR